MTEILTKTKVAIYARKSRDVTGTELKRQINTLIDLANSLHYAYEVFSDTGSSEVINPELDRMLKECDKGLFDGIMVNATDRLGRDAEHRASIIKRLTNNSISRIITPIKEYNLFSSDDRLVLGIQSEVDAYFMRMTKDKLLGGRIQAIKKGVFFGVAPFGYSKDSSKHLVPVEQEANIIKEIFKLYVNDGMNQPQIYEELSLRGYRGRNGATISLNNISHYLSNPVYKGTISYQLENKPLIFIENAHPAIIDAVTFDKAQEIRSVKRIVPQKSQRGVYPLSKLIVCPSCNQTLSFCMKYNNKKARATLDKDGRELYVLNCHSSKSKKVKMETKDAPRCSNYGVRASRIEQAVLEQLKSHLTDLDKVIESITAGDTAFLSDVAKRQKEYTSNLSKLETQKKKVQDGFKLGIYEAEEAQAEIEAIREQQTAIQKELKSLDGISAKTEAERHTRVKQAVLELLEMDTKTDPAKVNSLLTEVIDKVYYWKEKDDNNGLSPFELKIVYK